MLAESTFGSFVRDLLCKFKMVATGAAVFCYSS